jgi:uncharacterized membrane protein
MTFTNRERWAIITACCALSLAMVALVVTAPPTSMDGRGVLAIVAAVVAVLTANKITN